MKSASFKLDDYERNRFDSLGITIHPWQERPNSRLLNNFRANISAQVNPQFDAAVNFGYSTVEALTSNESNNTVGIGSQAFGGPGYRNNGLGQRSDRFTRRLPRWTPGLDLGGKAPAERQPHDPVVEPQLASDELAADARQPRHRLHRSRRHATCT